MSTRKKKLARSGWTGLWFFLPFFLLICYIAFTELLVVWSLLSSSLVFCCLGSAHHPPTCEPKVSVACVHIIIIRTQEGRNIIDACIWSSRRLLLLHDVISSLSHKEREREIDSVLFFLRNIPFIQFSSSSFYLISSIHHHEDHFHYDY